METLSLEQVKAYQGEYKVVPICRSMYADVRTPIEVKTMTCTYREPGC